MYLHKYSLAGYMELNTGARAVAMVLGALVQNFSGAPSVVILQN